MQWVLCFEQTVVCATNSKTRKQQSFRDLNLLCNVKYRTVHKDAPHVRAIEVQSVYELMKLSHKAISSRHIT